MDRVKSIQHNNNILWYDSAYQVATPVISCTANVVTMTCATTGATIRYSTNGGSSWSTYSSSITISATTNYIAYATKADMLDSVQVSYTATYMQTVATPVVSCTNNVVTMTCSTSGATIMYSTNGGSSWSTYSSSITITATTTYKAYATKSGMLDSAQTSYTATYQNLTVPTPVITKTAGRTSYGWRYADVKYECNLAGVTYYVNTGYGSTPADPTPTKYTEKFTGTGSKSETTRTYRDTGTSVQIKAIAVKTGYNNSAVKSVSISLGS